MKISLSTLAIAALLVGSGSWAQTENKPANATIPTGHFSGFVSNNSFDDLCDLNRGDIDFASNGNGEYTVRWQEQGYFRAPFSGFCENDYDATFTPSGQPNEWNVTFMSDFDMVFGKAVLDGNLLTVTADYSGGNNQAFLRFEAQMKFSDGQNQSVQYVRTIDRWGGSSLYASGVLH